MKFKNKSLAIVLLMLLFMTSCSSFLNTEPKGAVALSTGSATVEQAEGFVTAAYAGIGNDNMNGPTTSMWAYGSVHSDDAYKGGGGVADIGDLGFMEQYNLVKPDMASMLPFTWEYAYAAISRANTALRTLNLLTDDAYPKRKIRIAEARFLRAHSYFVLKVLFKYIPYIDETMSNDDILKVSNKVFTNDALWNKIADDFQYGIANLPATQPEVGRANLYSATAYLAKVRLYQAYEQNETNQVININQEKLREVVRLTDIVINSGKYRLEPDFGNNFLWGFDNGPESIFAIQYSNSDGTTVGRVSYVTGVNYPHGASQYACCGFHQPSQNLVNAFTTGADGLPKFTTFNDVKITPAMITPTGVTVDPRIDHSVGINGHPYKYRTDANYIFKTAWIRDPGIYGEFMSMKEQQAADCPCYRKTDAFIGTAKNTDIIRFDDVLLWQAEAYIELGQQEKAMPLINQVRARAAASTARLKQADGTPTSNYLTKQYDGTNLAWTQENARLALRWERRVEFALESPRFFDLVRWGVAAQELNAYIAKESVFRTFLQYAKFTSGRDEYFPIPQREIDFTKGLYIQNVGY